METNQKRFDDLEQKVLPLVDLSGRFDPSQPPEWMATERFCANRYYKSTTAPAILRAAVALSIETFVATALPRRTGQENWIEPFAQLW